ncbi:hypothetical protein LOZ53_005258 [Ophidiomyces ophidiicola]|nr:hypothetical protein LOZ55_003935 [Ophidiomyces ophidiicola]KAI1984942.1 hypothetical protein LOZ53_005258 [Ophidiomyces ophidiicola]KAI1996556.1 hypothetical protein LOZ54_000194 [Ophidiomyces ophidiicola]KAI1996772.1 hypothetical protein LOZ51_002934 [Ophidiomyces ophidiicola]
MSQKTSPTVPSPALKTPLGHSTHANTRVNSPTLSPQDPASQDAVRPFPAPQTFDILPPLHALLVRLLSTPPNEQQAAATNPDVSTEPVILSTPGVETTMHSLDPRALVTGASAVKIRIQKARSAIEELPDMQRSVEEQEAEIKLLEKKIARLKGVIGDFGQRAGEVVHNS